MLKWLSADLNTAAVKYERIRLILIKKFTWKQCSEPEDLADKVFDVVSGQLPKLAATYKGDPEWYFHGVAKNIAFKFLEQSNRYQMVELPETLPDDHNPEAEAEKTAIEDCRQNCLRLLEPEQRELLFDYYQNGNRKNPDFRKFLSDKYRMNPINLRVTAHRLRNALSICLDDCINNRGNVRA